MPGFTCVPLLALALMMPQAPPPPGLNAGLNPGMERGPGSPDTATQQTLKGQVLEMKTLTRGPRPMQALVLKVEGESWTVILGPEEMVKRLDLGVAVDATIEVVGPALELPEGRTLLAHTLKVGERTVELRPAKPEGMPGRRPF